MASGCVLGIAIAVRRARRLGLVSDHITQLAGWILLGGILGARAGHVFLYHWAYYKAHTDEIWRLWEGGMSSIGGFVGATIGGLWFVRSSRIALWDYGDVIAFAFMPAWALGRVGCFVIHDHPGRLSDFALAAQMQVTRGIGPHQQTLIEARHDLGLYDGLLSLGITGIFLWMDRRGPKATGWYLGWLCILYSAPRFFLDFLRATDISGADTRYAGLTPAQYGSIILVLLGGWILWYRVKGAASSEPPPS